MLESKLDFSSVKVHFSQSGTSDFFSIICSSCFGFSSSFCSSGFSSIFSIFSTFSSCLLESKLDFSSVKFHFSQSGTSDFSSIICSSCFGFSSSFCSSFSSSFSSTFLSITSSFISSSFKSLFRSSKISNSTSLLSIFCFLDHPQVFSIIKSWNQRFLSLLKSKKYI